MRGIIKKVFIFGMTMLVLGGMGRSNQTAAADPGAVIGGLVIPVAAAIGGCAYWAKTLKPAPPLDPTPPPGVENSTPSDADQK